MAYQFDRSKISALSGETQTVFLVGPGEERPLKIIASPRGVEFLGRLEFEDHTDLQSFAKILSDAWADHKKLRKKIPVVSPMEAQLELGAPLT